jgi:hypothetical protein
LHLYSSSFMKSFSIAYPLTPTNVGTFRIVCKLFHILRSSLVNMKY